MEAFIHLYPSLIKAANIRLNNTCESMQELSNSFNSLNITFARLAELSREY